MNTIQSAWAAHCRDHVSPRTPADKVLLLKKTFYAGAAGILNLMSAISGKHSDDAATKIVEGWYEEVRIELDKEIN